MKISKFIPSIAAAIVLSAAAHNAAAGLMGTIEFNAFGNFVEAGKCTVGAVCTATTTIDKATGINFTLPVSPANFDAANWGASGAAMAFGGTGDLANIADSTWGTVADIAWNPANTPLTPYWAFQGSNGLYQLSLTSVVLDSQDSDALKLSGVGTLEIAGDASTKTKANWSLTATKSSGNTSIFISTSQSTDVPVPEPSAAALLGLGLAGLVLGRRAIRK